MVLSLCVCFENEGASLGLAYSLITVWCQVLELVSYESLLVLVA